MKKFTSKQQYPLTGTHFIFARLASKCVLQEKDSSQGNVLISCTTANPVSTRHMLKQGLAKLYTYIIEAI